MTDLQLVLSIAVEQKSNQGEDSAACIVVPAKAALISALDGCGGAGARKYAAADNWTGARIASFSCAQTLADWFFDNRVGQLGVQNYDAAVIAKSLHQALDERMAELRSQTESGQGTSFAGSLRKPFPTTLSAALVSVEDGYARCLMMWAGDSRGFILSETGLYQITRDELKGDIDPFDNLERDGVLSNVISASGFHLKAIDLKLVSRCIVIVATDGCFGYLRSPMEFEAMLLSTLMASKSLKEWEAALSGCIDKQAGDDYTLQALSVGFDSFEQIRETYRAAYRRLVEQYGDPRNMDSDRDALRATWDQYKKRYLWESDNDNTIVV